MWRDKNVAGDIISCPGQHLRASEVANGPDFRG